MYTWDLYNKMSKFAKCVVCGCEVYTDGMGDDLIPVGYMTEDGWECEDCHTETDDTEEYD